MWRKSLIVCFVLAALLIAYGEAKANRDGFVETKGTRFVINGRPLYFNAYWLMVMASDPSTRDKVTDTFKEASKYGMNVARTWAFSDASNGGYRALQTSPGVYNEDTFKGLDFVVSEAKKNGIYLILSLVNNWKGFGGKIQYVQWAKDQGRQNLNYDDFFTNSIIKRYYKNHVKAVLTRVNSITGIAYKDDPTIFAWELMNEPRSQHEQSAKAIQDWVVEMSAYVKSIDKNHLLEVGTEGFYGESMPKRKQFNPGYNAGTDFISNHLIPDIDFATIHLYVDHWVSGNEEVRAEFVEKWIQAHINDAKTVLQKPIIISEFGREIRSSSHNVRARDKYLANVFNSVYKCANTGGPCGGAIFWQVMAQGMENWSDNYEVVLKQNPSTASIIYQQSRRISSLSNHS